MQFHSAEAWRRPSVAVRPFLVALIASVMSIVAGALAAATTWVVLVGTAACAVAPWLILAPSYLSLGSVLLVRGVSDMFADRSIVAGLNSGALIGLLLIFGALAQVLLRLYRRTDTVHGVILASGVLLGVGYWFGIGVLNYGMDDSLIREVVRTSSIVAVAVMAANADRSLTASRMATIVVVAALIPAGLVLFESMTNWAAIVAGEFRPRGTMSHPNAASIFFGIAMPIALWRAIFDRGGARYLVAALLFLVAIMLTRSLGGLAQAIVTLLAFGALQRAGAPTRVAMTLTALVIIGMFVLDPLGISRVSELESTSLTVNDGGAGNNSFEWRLVNWSRLMEEWRESPWLGHGLGSTYDLVTPLGHLPHSDPVRFLVETGVFGATLLSIGYLALMARIVSLWRRGSNSSLAGAVLAVMLGVSMHSLVTHVSFNTAPAYVLAALVGWTLTHGAESATARAADVKPAEAGASVIDRPPSSRRTARSSVSHTP